ncbi:MAG: polysaccharide biosynthesis/export family protein [Tepidisphaeraceae bacterium]
MNSRHFASRRARRLAFTAAAAAGVGSAALMGAGCSSNSKAKPASEAPPAVAANPTLGAGDELEIKFYYAPELNVQQKVRPDGMISLQLVGDVPAAGLTPAQLTDNLKKAYASQLRVPELAVIVRGQYSRRVYVAGEVARPGLVDMPANLSLWEAVILSGGFVQRNADKSQVIVVRTSPDGKRQGYAVDVRDEVKGAATTPFMLQPMDIVYVPRESIVDVGDWIDKNINSIVPKTGFLYTVNSGNATYGYTTR